jgi:hypothetical protein
VDVVEVDVDVEVVEVDVVVDAAAVVVVAAMRVDVAGALVAIAVADDWRVGASSHCASRPISTTIGAATIVAATARRRP